VRISEAGEVLEVLWDAAGENHPSITSTCEHKGWLYLGGVSNNRIGRVRLDGADATWTAARDYAETRQ